MYYIGSYQSAICLEDRLNNNLKYAENEHYLSRNQNLSIFDGSFAKKRITKTYLMNFTRDRHK